MMYPTFWANRLGLSAGELSTAAEGEGKTFNDPLTFINSSAA